MAYLLLMLQILCLDICETHLYACSPAHAPVIHYVLYIIEKSPLVLELFSLWLTAYQGGPLVKLATQPQPHSPLEALSTLTSLK